MLPGRRILRADVAKACADYAALMAERDQLRAERDELADLLRTVAALIHVAKGNVAGELAAALRQRDIERAQKVERDPALPLQ